MYYCIDSQNKAVGLNSSDFVVSLNPPICGAKKATLYWANIPNTIYNVQSNVNDGIVLIDPFGPINIKIPAQNYSIPVLTSTLATIFTNNGSQNYTVTYSPSTFKITVAAANAFALDFTGPESCASILGFTNTVTATTTSITAPNAVNLNAGNLYINIKELNNGVYSYNGVGQTYVIPINVNAGSTIQYEGPPAFTQSVYIPAPLYQFSIRLLRADNSLADLNGANWQMLLKFE